MQQKEVRIIGFTGVAAARYAARQYEQEPGLIKAGHVGVSLDAGQTIYGFHPTPEAAQALPATQDPFDYLLQGNTLPAGVYDDTAVFWRAHQLSLVGAPTHVWQQIIPVSSMEFDRIERELQRAVAAGSALGAIYRFSDRYSMPATVDNCATWPRRLGLLIPDVTGQIRRSIGVIKQHGIPWP
jgi:hypothetical protein